MRAGGPLALCRLAWGAFVGLHSEAGMVSGRAADLRERGLGAQANLGCGSKRTYRTATGFSVGGERVYRRGAGYVRRAIASHAGRSGAHQRTHSVLRTWADELLFRSVSGGVASHRKTNTRCLHGVSEYPIRSTAAEPVSCSCWSRWIPICQRLQDKKSGTRSKKCACGCTLVNSEAFSHARG